MFRLRRVPVFTLLAALSFSASACQKDTPPAQPAVLVAAHGASGPPFFKDMTAATGINFSYQNGQDAGHYAILESLGGGVGLIDFDRDGLLDIFAPGGGFYDGPDKQSIKGRPCKLYRNLGKWTFADMTAAAGLERAWPYTHGCAVGDYDSDGWPDLLVTGWGGVLLFHNIAADAADPKKGRKFVDVTQKAGLTDPRWSTSAGFADFDGDGFTDIYVCHYVDWSFANNPTCPGYTPNVKQDVCPPGRFKGLPDVIYRNQGNGTFADRSGPAGIRQMNVKEGDAGKGLGVVIADLNGDTKPDIYVANDTVDNFLYVNRGKFVFAEVGMYKGVARDEGGLAQGSMGLDVGDYNHSGWPSIFVTNYENENHALYKNLARNDLFQFSTTTAGIASIGQRYVGWGTSFIDVDHDGWLDLLIVNGHVIRHPAGAGLQQNPVMFHNQQGRFVDITQRSGEFFTHQHCGRGLAVGDLDNDGWSDFVVSRVNAPLSIQRGIGHEHPGTRHWLGIELAGKDQRNIVGTKVVVHVGGRKLTHFVKGGGSWGSAGDPRLLFGLGVDMKIARVTVTWAHGATQEWPGVDFTADRYVRLAEGAKEVK